jgi:hypothetical protein
MHRNIRIASRVLAACLFASLPAITAAQGMDNKPATPAIGSAQPPAQIYGKLLSGMEKEFVDLSEAMPEDKYSVVPTQGEFAKVRPFGDQIKHVAEANWYFFGGPDITDAQLKTKSDALHEAHKQG